MPIQPGSGPLPGVRACNPPPPCERRDERRELTLAATPTNAQPSFEPLVWLSQGQNAQLDVTDRHLVQMLARPGIPAHLKRVLADSYWQVRKAEVELARASELLEQMRTGGLNEAQCDHLYTLARRLREHLPTARARIGDQLRRLAAEDSVRCIGSTPIHALRGRLDSALVHVLSLDVPWDLMVRPVAAIQPGRPGEPIVAQCLTIPGEVLRQRLCDGYDTDDPINLPWLIRYTQAPDLEHTCLVDADGRTLFSGLMHSLIHATGLDAAMLNCLGRHELNKMVAALYVVNQRRVTSDHERRTDVRRQCRNIESDEVFASVHACCMRSTACQLMTEEVVHAALASNPHLWRQPPAAPPVELKLIAISLIRKQDIAMWQRQQEGLSALKSDATLRLRLVDDDGIPHRVSAALSVQRFPVLLPPGTGNPLDSHDDEPLLKPMLETRRATRLIVDIEAELALARARVSQLRHKLNTSNPGNAAPTRQSGANPAAASETDPVTTGLKKQLDNAEKSVRTLATATRQLRSHWAESGLTPSRLDVQIQLAARLALASHLIGRIPVLSCMSGEDFTRRVVAETNRLAMIAEGQAGELPPLDAIESACAPHAHTAPPSAAAVTTTA